MRFHDRIDAGRQLAAKLARHAHRSDVVVLGLPRGGIPVASEVASALGAPLDVFLVGKLGVPGHPELAMGAIGEGGIEVLSPGLIRNLDIPQPLVRQVAVRERLELDRRDAFYRGARRPAAVRHRTVILVDDGLATGSTMHAAILALRQKGPARIVVAVPVGARETCARLARLADEVVCVAMPEPFNAVGQWYEEFGQTSDDEVRRLLSAAMRAESDGRRASRQPRAIGVIYVPETERASHYFQAQPAAQFDYVLHFDETRALEPLERTPLWEAGEMAETFRSGLVAWSEEPT